MKKHFRKIIFHNLIRRPIRSAALSLLAAVLSGVILTGTGTVQSMEKGFAVMERRLGADIMVVPYAAVSKKNFDHAILLGNTGNFYMPGEYADKIAGMDGVERLSTQYYMTAADSGLCRDPVHLTAFDPETDFTVKPWIRESEKDSPGEREAVVGSRINAACGDIISFFDTELRVVAKLERTDTDYDATVFVIPETIALLTDASGDEVLKSSLESKDGHPVSVILLDVKEGYDIESVKDNINIHVKKVRAIQSQKTLTETASGLLGLSGTVKLLMAGVWVIVTGVMAAVLVMTTAERRKEFAVMRVIGAPRKKLFSMVVWEVLILAGAGALSGSLIALILIPAVLAFLQTGLSLPHLFPGVSVLSADFVLAMLVPVLTAAAAAVIAARRVTAQDSGLILRSEE